VQILVPSLVSILDKDSWQLVTTICDEGDMV
jgi:hypothetical protein